jgi:hypothetical protein
MSDVILLDRNAQLLQLIHALRPVRRLAGRLHRRQEQRDQNHHNRDDHQQLD